MREPAAIYAERVYSDALPELVQMVDPGRHDVLDLGCGNGANLRLLQSRGYNVTGLTISAAEAKAVGPACVVADLVEGIPFPPASFDAVVASHVLEHLAWPELTLEEIARILRPGGRLYVALPNVAHFPQRLALLRGRFRYVEGGGVMDRTHLRFFDFHSARALLDRGGWRILRHEGVGHLPVGPLRELAPALSRTLDRAAGRAWPNLFAFHILLEAQR